MYQVLNRKEKRQKLCAIRKGKQKQCSKKCDNKMQNKKNSWKEDADIRKWERIKIDEGNKKNLNNNDTRKIIKMEQKKLWTKKRNPLEKLNQLNRKCKCWAINE